MICATWSRPYLLLHVADHLFAAVLAEVDVEVRHRHAVGIEEALEQQREAQRIDVGDGERIGDQRARARAASRPDRDAVRLRPFDEVGDDQEVAGELHALDDAELELQPLAILLLGVALASGRACRSAARGLRAPACAVPRPPPSRRRSPRAGEARQDRLALLRIVRAAHGDLDGVVDRLGQVGKKRRHFRLALQVVVGRQPAAVVGRDHRAFGDGDQRVMRVEILARRERTPRWSRPAAVRDGRPVRSLPPRCGGPNRRRAPVRHRAGRRKSA